jgi:hypothetical protein
MQKRSHLGFSAPDFFCFLVCFFGTAKLKRFCSVNHFLKRLPVERDEKDFDLHRFYFFKKKSLYNLSLNLIRPEKELRAHLMWLREGLSPC